MNDTYDCPNLYEAALLWYLMVVLDGKSDLDLQHEITTSPIGNSGRVLFHFPGREVQRERSSWYRDRQPVEVIPTLLFDALNRVRSLTRNHAHPGME